LSLQCAAAGWKGTLNENGQQQESHRAVCNEMKVFALPFHIFAESVMISEQTVNLKRPEMQAIAEQFPWARQETDGTFAFDIFLASQGLVGSGREFGYWTKQPCCADKSRYVWGFMLLQNEHLKDGNGWKLPDEQIPWLDFAPGRSTPPKFPPPLEHTWSKYYEWRGLPMESPAALLLHWPLTVYRLLHLLGLASAHSSERRHLTVYLLGIEKEVDFLPL
jgi:hypothetical protein